ncbi:MAG: hypothetical protein B6D61_15160 [Bacteroidetes bacterium 4484_249]|nr:MAG: hypothetical protein B6D61_15160 [Bacteroidetes bacterium 4484_249]
MQLDIYAFDAGAIDGKRFYGSMKSNRFIHQFPYGFDSIYQKANRLGIRLGIWGGPDGFGDTPQEEQERTEQMVSLCRDYHFALFKFDAVCGPLRPEKEDAFINMMKQCRTYSPDLILLNHRLGLEKAKAYATTFLWGGAETYIDVFMTNNTTAPHHRAAAISRGLVPDLKRLTEDHGVCISSCLDYWDDDLILQAFNRSLILAPEIYGNPWLLKDDEFPKLARIYNLHRKYGKIIVEGMVLPEESYGPYAVSRGDSKTRLITLRNLSWLPKDYEISLGEEIGITDNKSVRLIQIHPYEEFTGQFDFNEKANVSVEPFRSALFIATVDNYDEPLIKGTAFQIVRNVTGKSILIDIVGDPGTEATISLEGFENYESAKIDGLINQRLLEGKSQKVKFKGEKLKLKPHRKITDLTEIEVPEDADVLYEATVFSADNNALEVRSILRSGKSAIPAVQNARNAFFNQNTFVNRGVWDKNLFDSDLTTGFWPSKKYDIDLRIKGGTLRLDLGEITDVDSLIVLVPDYFSLHPLLPQEGNYVEISTDLKNWETLTYLAGLKMTININKKVRYLRFKYQPQQIVEIEGYHNGILLDRSGWRASNLFAHPDRMKCVKSWKAVFTLEEMAKNSYLSVAINGKHGIEGAYVAAKIDGQFVGAPDRASSYPSNTWEYVNAERDANYTYYIPVDKSAIGKKIEVFVMAYDEENTDIKPEVWISAFENGKEKIRIELQ